MFEEKDITENAEYNPDIQAEGETAEAELRHVVQFRNPYNWEGKEYTSVDLSGLDNLTVKDAIDAQRKLFSEREIAALIITETTTAFARELAARASGKPIEFFKQMPRGPMRQVIREVRECVTAGADSIAENHIMRLEEPVFYRGQEYREIDLNKIAEMNSMSDSAAENRMAREGFMVADTSANYLYACVVASMATGLPEDFFTGLPVCETVKLKNAVNDGDFFE